MDNIKTVFTCEHGKNACPYCAEAIADLRQKHDRAVQAWIPIEERLPEVEGDYLVTRRYNHDDDNEPFIDTGYFRPGWERVGSLNNGWVPGGSIIAWMPLPSPYRAEAALQD